MIEHIGVVCQDRNSFGFLQGIRRRLGCNAELVEPTTGALGKSTRMNRRQAALAWADLRKKGVDLVIRFTDADGNRWQDIRRHEMDVFPQDSTSLLVCGVAVDNTEQWLALDRTYLGQALGLFNLSSTPSAQLTGMIKTAIARAAAKADDPVSEVTARIVANAPAEVFRSWLRLDDSLRTFYEECRAAAIRSNCAVPNELDASE